MKNIKHNHTAGNLKKITVAMLSLVIMALLGVLIIITFYKTYDSMVIGLADPEHNNNRLVPPPDLQAEVKTIDTKAFIDKNIELLMKKYGPNLNEAKAWRIVSSLALYEQNIFYQAFFNSLGMSNEELGDLKAAMVARDYISQDIAPRKGAKAISFSLDGVTYQLTIFSDDGSLRKQEVMDITAEQELQIRSILGEEKYEQYQYFMDTFPLNGVLSPPGTFSDQTGLELTEYQLKLLVDSMHSADQNYKYSGRIVPLNMDKVILDAANYLSGVQLARLKSFVAEKSKIQAKIDEETYKYWNQK